jgi:hypothetical protein
MSSVKSLSSVFPSLSRRVAPSIKRSAIAPKWSQPTTGTRTFSEAFADISRKRYQGSSSLYADAESSVKCRQRKSKFTATLDARLVLGEEMDSFKNELSGCRHWVAKFARIKAPALPAREFRMFTQSCKRSHALYSKYMGGQVSVNKQEQGKREAGVRTASRTYRNRRNVVGGGRRIMYQELSDELWDWFISTISSLKCRIDSAMLIAKAESIKEDMAKFNKKCEDAGDAHLVVKLPESFSHGWLFRWRRYYGVSFRTRNICYKISRNKLLSRCGVFWRNLIRFRTLFFLIHKIEAKFISGDQKPFLFNAVGSSKMLTVKGVKFAEAIESHAATRERFSGMSTCKSWLDAFQKE